MGRIITGLSLRDVLRYSGHHLEFRGDDEADSVITFNRTSKYGAKGLAELIIAGINHGDFNGYKNGRILFGNDALTFKNLEEIDEQEGWLREAEKGAKMPEDGGAITGRNISTRGVRLRLYEGVDYLESWVNFYFNGARRSSPPRIDISRQSKKFGEDRVRGILSPLLKEGELGDVVKEIMSVKILKLGYLAGGAYSTHAERKYYTINSQDELREIWGYLKDGPSMPKVNFRTHMVVAVFQGAEPTRQCGVGIGGVAEFEDRVEVHTAKTQMGDTTGSLHQSPYDIVRVPKRSKKEVVFVEGKS